MIRRQVFFGLTLVLLAAVIFLLLRGRNADKEREAQDLNAEEVQTAPASPTRVLTPRNLKLVQTKVSFAPTPEGVEEEGEGSVTAHHDITVQNSGGDVYGGLRLRLEYLDRNGKVLVDRIHAIGEPLSAQETLRLEDIAIDDLPDGLTDCRVSIISADLAFISQ